MDPKASYFFEVSFEVANKVGGIYTVIASKAPVMIEKYREGYITIGPWFDNKSMAEFTEKSSGEFKDVFAKMKQKGITCHMGTWNIHGNPKAILLDVASFAEKNKNQIKAEFWEKYQIDSLKADYMFDEPVVLSYAAGMLIDEISKKYQSKKCVAQFHEWMSGAGLLYLKSIKSQVGTVFTTHATMLGRSIAGSNEDLHGAIEDGLKNGKTADPKKAYDHGIEAKHLTEVACAKNADVFTTVSETTSKEAEYILGKKADIVLPNGLTMANYPSMEELAYMHKLNKENITTFLQAYFQPYYDINIEDPRIMFISGRYEYHNKGIDMFIDALGRLNSQLKKEKSQKDVFVFLLIPSNVDGENIEVLKNVTLFNDIENYVDDILPEIKRAMMGAISRGKEVIEELNDHITSKHLNEIKKQIMAFRSKKNLSPPLCAFNLNYDSKNDSINKAFGQNGLMNRKEDRVKVIFYPAYLSNADRLVSLNYDAFIIGSSLGVFPSFYEPWGYTPVECAANGCLSITTDYAGFGKFIDDNRQSGLNDKKDRGIYILRRENTSYDESTEQLKKKLHEVIHMSKNEIVAEKHIAHQLAQLTDWKLLGEKYIEAHNKALK